MVFTFPRTYFCYLDILGFSRYVLNLNNITDLQANPTEKQKLLLNYYNIIHPLVMGPIYGQHHIFTNEDVNKLIQSGSPRLNSYIISDSILLWTDDVSHLSFILLLDVVKHIIMTNMTWSQGFPIRGAISMGSLSFNHTEINSSKLNITTSLVGDALVKAADLEWKQNWAGCAVNNEIIDYLIERYPMGNILTELEEWKLLVKYKVPMKQNPQRKAEYAVVWPSHFSSGPKTILDLPIKLTFERNEPMLNPSITQKYENTLEFVHYLFTLYSREK